MDRSAEQAILAGPAILAEWLAATDRIWPAVPHARLAEIAAFSGLEPRLGWHGNLRRRRSRRTAVIRGERSWSFADLAGERSWRDAAGPMAQGDYVALVRAVADHLLCADTRPDDRLVWRGDPHDPWPWGALIIGASLEIKPPDANPGGP